ncbi:restriction endonuclease subunit S [Bacillus subtilis]|uniref:restriction endonuclease subunit S n=1 Tax=Bacillus subtilis TaxID=1423 RepID=UPI001FF8CA5D|nr:restriction endonuclease subunit S [Bacillus subtilis]UPG82314.1 restriction endonuclease subunit S [Bacillus subtilis]
MFELKYLSEFTYNLDNRRKPLNAQDRALIQNKMLYPYCGANGVLEYVDEYLFDEKILCLAEDGGSWGYNQKCTYIMNEPCWVNNHAHVLTAKENISLEYLSLYLNSVDLNKYITGTTRGKLTKTALEKIQIPIPSYELQIQIVKLIGNISSIIKKRQSQIAALDELTQSVFLDMFNTTNDKVKIGDIAEVQTGSTPSRKNDSFWKNGSIPWVKTAEVKMNYIESSEECITQEALEKTSVSILPINTVLIAMYGQGVTRGRVGLLKTEATTNQACAAILPNEKFNSEFLFKQLVLNYKKLRHLGRGGNQPNLNLSLVKDFEILLPPLSKQEEFNVISENIELRKKQLKISLNYMESLYESLLQKAFKGELSQEWKLNESVSQRS